MENQEETNGKRDFRRNLVGVKNVLNSQHDSPSPEGSHPASGRSPDSRFLELTAFPIPLQRDQWLSWPALHDHSGGAVPDSHRVP